MKSYPAKFKSFSAENSSNGNVASCKIPYKSNYNFVAYLPNLHQLSILSDIWKAIILPFLSSKYFYSW